MKSFVKNYYVSVVTRRTSILIFYFSFYFLYCLIKPRDDSAGRVLSGNIESDTSKLRIKQILNHLRDSERSTVVIIIFHLTLSYTYKCLRYIVILFYRSRVHTFTAALS